MIEFAFCETCGREHGFGHDSIGAPVEFTTCRRHLPTAPPEVAGLVAKARRDARCVFKNLPGLAQELEGYAAMIERQAAALARVEGELAEANTRGDTLERMIEALSARAAALVLGMHAALRLLDGPVFTEENSKTPEAAAMLGATLELMGSLKAAGYKLKEAPASGE